MFDFDPKTKNDIFHNDDFKNIYTICILFRKQVLENVFITTTITFFFYYFHKLYKKNKFLYIYI